MSMNPRLLRPTASGFTPRSISGLALWLDASSTDSLYTTDAGPVTPVRDPLDIAGCLCWYDAADASSITKDGSNLVSQWNDKSSNARHATASGSLRPTSGGSQNGRTVMQFTGTQAMTITGNFLQADNVTMFAVAMKNTDHYGGIISSAPTNPEDSPVLCFYLTTIAWLNRRVLVQQATGNSVYRIVSGQSVGTAQQGFFDGVRGTDTVTATPTNTTNTITKIGALRTGSTADLNGTIAEIVCYSGNLTTADRARVEAYLAAKWGIAGVHAPATATSDPVGHWADKSGNGRHAVQATAGSRPVVGTVNSRRALTLDGTDDFLSADVAPSSLCSTSGGVAFYVAVPNNDSAWAAFTNSGVVGGLDRFLDSASYHGNFRQTRFSEITPGAYSTTGAQLIVSRANASTGLQTIRKDGATIYSAAENIAGYRALLSPSSVNVGATVTVMGPPVVRSHFLAGSIPEIICYSSPLTDVQVRRIETYLAARWGITLAPQVANADAQNWIDRVYQNGGSVSSATASAVNTFCESIASAGIRDRFYRLNLFAGNSDASLNAVRTPLFRGPSLGGTQYGGTTDTNNNFVAGDYSETSGLLGNGSTKYLDTGLAGTAFSAGDRHCSAYWNANSTLTGNRAFIGNTDTTSNTAWMDIHSRHTNPGSEAQLTNSAGLVHTGANRHQLVQYNGATSAVSYSDGGDKKTLASFPAGAPTAAASNWFVFGVNPSLFGGVRTDARICTYSIGLSMSDANALAFYNAVHAFQTALTRNV